MTLQTCPSCQILARPGACPSCGAAVPTARILRSVAAGALALVAASNFIACTQEMYGIAGIPFEDGDFDGISAPQDCDDADPAVFPGADEVPGNGLDDDCDGVVDEATA